MGGREGLGKSGRWGEWKGEIDRTRNNILNLLKPKQPFAFLFLANEEVHHFMARTGCRVPGCRGTGHTKGPKFSTHQSVATCPYAPENLDNENNLPDRLNGNEPSEESVRWDATLHRRIYLGGESSQGKLKESIFEQLVFFLEMKFNLKLTFSEVPSISSHSNY